MPEPTVVVTGANRGIGLSLCKYYQEAGAKVIAICRSSSVGLQALGVRVIDNVDIAKPADVASMAEALKGQEIDILINNAGILRNEILGSLDFASIQQQFEVNTLGPLRVCEALLKNLAKGAKIALITSRMGSISDNTSGGRYGYRISKCALNIAGVSLARDLAPNGIAVGLFHPGLVGTDMIGGVGDITPDEAAQRLVLRIADLDLNNSGSFWHSNGELLPW